MTLLDWSEAMSRQLGMGLRARRRGPRLPGVRRAPRLEVLEDRTVLSTLTVTNNLDGVSVLGSLRYEIAQASPGDTIKFASDLKGQIITLTQGQLAITENLTIRGFADKQPTISSGDRSRVFAISSGASVAIDHLTIASGFADSGGGVVVEPGASLTLDHDTLTGNQADGGAGAARCWSRPAARWRSRTAP